MKISHKTTGAILFDGDTSNLSGANLRGADLSGANLRGADLSGADLRNVSKRMIAWEDHYKRFPDKVVRPHAASVLHSLLWDSDAAEQSFASWCADLGYDTDSRKAWATYETCQVNADKLCRVFDRTARAALREVLQEY